MPSLRSRCRPALQTRHTRPRRIASKPQFTSPWRRPNTARNSKEPMMLNKYERSRRQFLRTASMASMAGFYASPFLIELNSLAAMAQESASTGYRALVCVYLQGGNDGHGTVIATDPSSFAAFTQARSGAPGLAYPKSELLPIKPKTAQGGHTFALNPSLQG